MARTINGNTFRSRLDILASIRDGFRELFTSSDDATARRRFIDARPFPVYSCWNGMIVMDARPFVAIRPDGELRKHKMPTKFRPAMRHKRECGELAAVLLRLLRSNCGILSADGTLSDS